MEITILGSGTGVPSLKRGAPGLVIKTGKQILLFDSGSGTLNRLLKAKIDYRKIDCIFYTHFHPDHFAELVPFLFACRYHSSPRTKPLIIFGPKGLKNIYSRLMKIYGKWVAPVNHSITVKEMGLKPLSFKGCVICAKILRHSDVDIGYRIEDKRGKIVVYSGDTDYCPEIIKLAENSDIFISECSFPERYKIKGHLTPRLAGKIARESNCRSLVLAHLYPVCDKYDIASECRKEYKGKITVAKDLLKIMV